MKAILINIKNALLLIVGLNVLYLVLCTIAFIPSNRMIQEKLDNSLALIEEEGPYPSIGKWRMDKSRTAWIMLDNFTDRTMLNTTIRNTDSPFTAAVNANGYSRYWHGYISILRPLLLLMRYDEIRYLNIFVFTFLIFIAAYVLVKKINILAAIALLISLGMAYVNLLQYSMDCSLVFILMLIAVIVAGLYATRWNGKKGFFFFLQLRISPSQVQV
jgi:hypothetical protein